MLVSPPPFPNSRERALQGKCNLSITLPGFPALANFYSLCQTGDSSFYAHRRTPARYLLGIESDTTF
jgi:hypothetical protein